MKKLYLALFLMISVLSVKANIKSDTTIVEFTDKGVKKRVTVYTSSKRDFDLPKTLDLDNVLKSIGVDSVERKKAVVLAGNEGEKQDTILVIARDGRSIKIVLKAPKEISVKQDTLRNDGDHWSHEERVYKEEPESENEVKKKKTGSGRFFSRSDFGLYIGLNNWAKGATTGSSLDTWGSRYVALSFRRNATLINGKQVDLAFSYGPEVAWNNFMLEENNTVQMSGKQVVFKDFGQNLSKSKLVVPMLNFPMMLNFGFEEAKFRIGLGGYVGYRIGGYSKLKYDDGKKEKLKGSYSLNDFRYGLTAELGKRKGVTFFFRYDLSEMFKSEQINAKGLQAWSVGLRL
ncbi:hypothetical protein EMA8858_03356 [Emticicia aquatica]|uniref:Outer membrane protein beta-barrel domain-containing protein n=1 Tax=Emticicia aquatica TaxID=1681835 RepID=A0ABM9AU65_9BACT|nr:hypothetical protein [Emticicia aquatica]CAH0997216.1 hypothetical protein EMA8858_03356 [Emticicia aquatica]